MKYIISIILLVSVFSTNLFSQGYKIKVKVEGIKDTICYLANYYGDKQYYKDTASVDKNGYMEFTGKKPLEGGIYSVVIPGMKYFEIIVNEQNFSVETDTTNLIYNLKVKGSEENRLFYEYLRYLDDKQKISAGLREKYQKSESEEDKKKYQEELSKIDADVKAFRIGYINNHSDKFVGKLFKSMSEPEIPEAPEGVDKDKFNYYYFKNHFWDNVDFSDARLLRCPVYHNKLKQYFEQLVVSHPDSIIKEAEFVVSRAKADPEIFKYTVVYLTSNYERSKIMGMDAVFVHMALNYYCKGFTPWADSAQVNKICDRAKTLDPLLLGKVAQDLTLVDTTGKVWQNLHSVDASYTILVFWDPDCGHCKKEIPKLVEVYKKLKDKGVKVYAVSSEENTEWKKFIREKEMDFINVAVPKAVYKDQKMATELVLSGVTDIKSLNYHNTYDIFSTPQIYLLDKDKKIVAKRLEAEQLEKLLLELMKRDGEGK